MILIIMKSSETDFSCKASSRVQEFKQFKLQLASLKTAA
jgi:hypothetical protein